MEKDELGMDLFGSEENFELDFDFTQDAESSEEDTVADIEKDGELPSLEHKKEVSEETEEELKSPSDDKSQENVAKEKEDKDGDQDDESSPNLYTSFAAVLKEQGLLSSLNEDIKDVDSLVSAVKKEIKSSEFADLTDTQKEYLEAVRNGIPEAEFFNHKEVESNLGNITEDVIKEDQELRKRIIYQDYVNQGLSPERSAKLAERSVNNERDLEDALEALPSIKEYEKTMYNKKLEDQKQAVIDAQKKENKEKELLKETVLNKDLFDNFEISGNAKDAVYKDMTTIVDYDGKVPENRLMKYRRENPVEFDAKLYTLFNLTNGFKDFTRFDKKGVTSAVNQLERTLKSSNFANTGGQPSFITDPESYSGIGDELVID